MVGHFGRAPRWSLQDLRALIQEDAWELGTRTCRRDVTNLDWDRQTTAECLLSITEADFRGTWPGTAATDFGDIEADVYKVHFDEAFLYVKLGIHTNDEGDACLVASLHLDGRP
jgi:hypothetical protein